MFKPVIFLGILILAPQVWAAHKCTGPDGKISYQDAPCTGQGEKFEMRPVSGVAPTPSAPAYSTPAPPPSIVVPPSVPLPVAQLPPLTREADTCLAWYKPKLRDPAGAYYTAPSKEGRVLSITIHATNGYGGYVTRSASCEIHNGKLDADWTKIHATRQGW